MDRSVEQEARLNQLRQVEMKFFRESHKLAHNPISLPFTQVREEESMTNSVRTTTCHTITPSRDSTPPVSNLHMRELSTPLRPLNQNRELFSEADDLAKKTSSRSPAAEAATYSRKYWPTSDDEDPPSSQEILQSIDITIPCYPRGDLSCERSFFCPEEEATFAGGYLEDDISIPPPPVHPTRFGPHHCFEPYPPPHPCETFHSYYYEPPAPQQDCYYLQPPPPAYSPVAVHGNGVAKDQHHHENGIVTVSHQPTAAARSSPIPGELQELDIVCGRGAPTNYHYGNQAFKDLVGEYQTGYLCAKRCDKPQLAMKVMDIVKERGGRFVRREKTSGRSIWVEIDPKGAYEKVCQALRQGAPEIRSKTLASTLAAEKESLAKGKAS
jgi:hypothetical protein